MMDIGFFHPERGYWQAIDVSTEPYIVVVEPERIEIDDEGNETVIPAVTRETTQIAEMLASYPAGTIQVPLKPGPNHEWIEGAWVHVPPPLDGLKATLKARLDEVAETERLKYITGGAGQAMTYQQKAAEAAACLADPAPDPVEYPLLAAEIGITAETLVGVATVVFGQHQAWRVIGAQIEAARLNGKKAIDAALSAEDAQAAFELVEWPAAA